MKVSGAVQMADNLEAFGMSEDKINDDLPKDYADRLKTLLVTASATSATFTMENIPEGLFPPEPRFEMIDRISSIIHRGMMEEDYSEDIAKDVIEAMRAVPEVCYDHYRCDKTWRELNSTEVWNLWIDAALKETK